MQRCKEFGIHSRANELWRSTRKKSSSGCNSERLNSAKRFAGALEDQEKLEDQFNELMLANKKAKEQAAFWRTQLEQGGLLIEKLEDEKRELLEKIDNLERQLEDAEKVRSERKDMQESLTQEIKMLKSAIRARPSFGG